MKKTFVALLALILALTVVLALSSCNKVEFKVNFIVDGEVYDTVSTGGGETIRIPANPTKEGYTFGGWYWDNNTWREPFTANSLLDAPLSSDMSVYAKWVATDTQTPDDATVGISFKSLSVNGNKVYGKVSNDTEYYSFIGEVNTSGDAKYTVSYDIGGTEIITAKTINLAEGDNTVYVTELIDDEPTNVYIVTIRRRLMYEVTFDSKGGAEVDALTVEEDSVLTAPKTSRAGYTFVRWDYDFTKPITENTLITAEWQANDKTPYRVEYYFENLGKTDYDLISAETENLTGTTDTKAEAEKKTFEHFTFNPENSIMSGNIDGEGNLVLKVYYTRDNYTVSNKNSSYGSITNSGSYAYGKEITLTVNSVIFGRAFVGWYSGDKLISTNTSITVTIDNNIEARFDTAAEMKNFEFTSNATTCYITGIKDKAVTEILVPSYVTGISSGAFKDCSSLGSITLPFAGYSASATGYTSHFGYIFGYSRSSSSNDSYHYRESGNYYTFNIPTSLKTVTITGPSSIGGEAFRNCSYLTSVTIGKSVTSIGSSAFYMCSALTSINIDSENTKYQSINGNLYSKDGTILVQYAIGKSDTSFIVPNSVTNIGSYAFRHCSKLTSVTIPDSVITINHGAFQDCSLLQSITLPFVGATKGGTGTTHFGYIFGASSWSYNNDYIPSSLKSVTITGSSSIGTSAFSGCSSLTSIEIPDGATSVGECAFYMCSSLESVKLGNCIKSIGYDAFQGCSSLSNVKIPDSVINIGESAFSGCSKLASIIIPDNVTSIGSSAFEGCSSLESITLPFVGAAKGGTSNTHFGYIFGASSYIDNGNYVPSSLKSVTITGSSNIGNSAFRSCSSITSIEIPDGVTSIGGQAFQFCSKLTNIIIPDSITSIGESALSSCSALKFNQYDNAYYLGNDSNPYICLVKATDTNISSCIIHNDTKFIHSSAFYSCSALSSITIPVSVTSIHGYAFCDCPSLQSITIPDSVTSIGYYAFDGCSALKFNQYDNAYYLGNDSNPYICLVKAIDTTISSCIIHNDTKFIYSSAFLGCSSLASIEIPDGVTSIGWEAFSSCSSLASVTIGNGVTSIGYYAFRDCSSLASITIPDSVTTIGGWAFRGCSKLTNVTIGNGVTSIGYWAFYCRALKSINYRGTESQWNAITKDSEWDYGTVKYTIIYNYTEE